MNIICLTDSDDTNELKNENNNLNLQFIDSFENIINAKIYIVSLKKASVIFHAFVDFMRKNPESKFLFLEEYKQTLTDEDFEIREEPNTDIYMYTPKKALKIAMELTNQAIF